MATKKTPVTKTATENSPKVRSALISMPLRRRLTTFNELLEDFIAISVVVLLFAIAVRILWDSTNEVIAMFVGDVGFSVTLLSQIMLALILAEIIATVNVFLKNGIFSPIPFLVVAVIASVRRILQISIENKGIVTPEDINTGSQAFNSLSVELALLAIIIGVCAWAISLLRQSNDDLDEIPRQQES